MDNDRPDPNPYELIERRIKARAEERLRMNKRLAQMNVEDDKDKSALEVIRDVMTNASALGAGNDEPGTRELPPGSVAAIQQQATGKLPAKQMILNVLKAAYPNGLMSKQIAGKVALKYKAAINPNTLSVSLSRHQADRRVRLEGKTWFYVKTTEYRMTAAEMDSLAALADEADSHAEAAE